MILNALTIDVEEYFHAENLRAAYPRETWDSLESRLEEPLETIRALLASRGARATFFVLGWVADRMPWIVRALAADGHEIASHGYGHELITRMSPGELEDDIRRASRVLELLSGRKPRGYRAPCFTITSSTRWALEVLADLGFEYDSSVFPIVHDRYGDPHAPTDVHEIRLGRGRRIVEAPPATVRLLGRNLPVAGGGYLRLLPFALTAEAIASRNASGKSAVVYFHPWELDRAQPVHAGVPLRRRIRHSIGTAGLLAKLERLLDRFAFGPLETVLERERLLAPPVARPVALPEGHVALALGRNAR